MPGEAAAVSAVAVLLSKVFGFAVDADGFAQLSRENQLKFLARGLNEAIDKNDWPTVQALFNSYRQLKQETDA